MPGISDEFSLDHPSNKRSGKHGRLLLLNKDDSLAMILRKKFFKGWKHPQKPQPFIHALFKILSSAEELRPYHEYRASVSESPSLQGREINPANEQLLFHGTNRFCQLGEDSSNVRLCELSQCYLCCIIRNSFDVSKCGTKNKFRRFGTGIYTTACSSKADDYNLNGDQSVKLRVLLVSRVVVGHPYRRKKNATNLTEPPEGYHSVIGDPGIDLNYEETVVYDNDAIRPAFIIVYGDTPVSRRKLKDFVAALFKTPLAS